MRVTVSRSSRTVLAPPAGACPGRSRQAGGRPGGERPPGLQRSASPRAPLPCIPGRLGGIARGRVCSAALEIPWPSGWRWDRDQGEGFLLLSSSPAPTGPGSDSGLDRIATSGGLRTRPDDPSAARPPPTCGRADPGCFPVPQSPSRPRGREGGRPADRDTHA
ncbi:hypothetical protein JHW43_009626 [Diplocarpon mali]|nr:hypothetical protein JHW43_009626 [Diplocarpon mali]